MPAWARNARLGSQGKHACLGSQGTPGLTRHAAKAHKASLRPQGRPGLTRNAWHSLPHKASLGQSGRLKKNAWDHMASCSRKAKQRKSTDKNETTTRRHRDKEIKYQRNRGNAHLLNAGQVWHTLQIGLPFVKAEQTSWCCDTTTIYSS